MTTTTPRIAQADLTANATGRWELDPGESEVAFRTKKFWGLVTVSGTFDDLTGSIDVADDGGLTGTLAIRAASVDTGQAKRDEHLRSADFFDAEHHPELQVRIDRVTLSSASEGIAHGVVTVLGVARPVEFPARIEADERQATVTASLVIDRSEHGMTWSPLRMAAMEVDVDVRLAYRRAER